MSKFGDTMKGIGNFAAKAGNTAAHFNHYMALEPPHDLRAYIEDEHTLSIEEVGAINNLLFSMSMRPDDMGNHARSIKKRHFECSNFVRSLINDRSSVARREMQTCNIDLLADAMFMIDQKAKVSTIAEKAERLVDLADRINEVLKSRLQTNRSYNRFL